MDPKLELDEAPDYLEWLLKTKGIELDKLKKSIDKVDSDDKSMDMIKIQELEQTKELLVHLNNKLFKKIESLEAKVNSEDQIAAEEVLMMKVEINRLLKQALELQTQSLAGVSSERIEVIRLEMTALECMKRIYTFLKRISREFVPQEIRD